MTTATATTAKPTTLPRHNGHPIVNLILGIINLFGALFSLLPLVGNLGTCTSIPLLIFGLIASTNDAFFNGRATNLHYVAFGVNALALVFFAIGWWVI